MKYLISILLLSIVFTAKAQFTGTDSLRNYNNKYITNNAATSFTNLRLNTLLRGMIDWIDTARAGTGGGGALGVDTLWALNDSTIRYRKNGVFRNVIIKGVYDTRKKVDTMYKVNDTTIGFTINGIARSIIIPGRHYIDSIYRKSGQDSIFYRKEGIEYSIKDSTGGGGSGSALDWVNVVDFGADTTGATNSTTAIQNAFNSLGAGRPKIVYFPSGTYLTSGNIHVPSCRIIGVSGTNAMGFDAPQGNRTFKFDGTKILCNSATNDLFIFDSSGTIIENCALINTAATTPSAGAGIKSMKPSTKILHCAISGFYDNVWLDESPEYFINDVFFSQYVRYGVYHRTFIEPDAGDQCIANSWFYPRKYNAQAGIHIESGGGIKLSNLKFNANSVDTLGVDCIQLVMDNVTTSDLLITNCSLENYSGKGISIKTINSGAFYHIVINGNQFAPNSADADAIFIDGSAGTIRDVAITGNAIGNADTAVYLNSIESPSLVGNVFDVVNADIVTVNTSESVQLNWTKLSVNPNPFIVKRSLAADMYNVLKNNSSSGSATAGYRLVNSGNEYMHLGLGSSSYNGSSAYLSTSASGSNIGFYPNLTEALWMDKDTVRISSPKGLFLRNGNDYTTFQNLGGALLISSNAYFDGSNWQRFKTSDGSWNHYQDPGSDAFIIRRTAAGAGTITWSEKFKITGAGAVTINNAYTLPTSDGSGGQVMATNGSGSISFSTLVLKGSTTWQPGTVAAGNSATTTVTVTGAATTDVVHVNKVTGGYSNGEIYDAWVSSTNTVTIRVHNVSTGSANYNTTETYNVIVLKY